MNSIHFTPFLKPNGTHQWTSVDIGCNSGNMRQQRTRGDLSNCRQLFCKSAKGNDVWISLLADVPRNEQQALVDKNSGHPSFPGVLDDPKDVPISDIEACPTNNSPQCIHNKGGSSMFKQHYKKPYSMHVYNLKNKLRQHHLRHL